MRFHVVGLAHTYVKWGAFESCAFTQKVRKFGKMMSERKHKVFIYAPKGSMVKGCQIVECLDEEDRKEIVGGGHYTAADWNHEVVSKFNAKVIKGLEKNLKKGDFICIIGGLSQKGIADAFEKEYKIVEFGIGYGGSFAPFRVFESSAWMHVTYGAEGGRSPNNAKASWWDDVIPNYFELKTLPFQPLAQGYLAFMGRLNPDKGLYIASQVGKDLGMEFKYAGPENGFERPGYGEYVGELNAEKKAEFLGGAAVVLCPSTYIEPFCGVAVEAQLCGTPVVATDWGAFRENIAVGRTGFRARTFTEFKAYTQMALSLKRKDCHEWGKQFGLEPIGLRYEHYFKRLCSVGTKEGWYL